MISNQIPKYFAFSFLLFTFHLQINAQLSSFSDEFDDANSIENWTLHNSGLLSDNYYETLILNDSLIEGTNVANAPLGQLTLIPGPGHCGWYANTMGPLIYKTIGGNFSVTTYVSVQNKNDLGNAPTSNYNSAGLLIRDPDTEGSENYIMCNMGLQSYSNGVGTETKNTDDGVSTLYLNPDELEGWIRICRVGDIIRTFKQTAGDTDWVLLLEQERPDFPDSLQVGLMANNWDPQGTNPPHTRSQFDFMHYTDVFDLCDCELPDGVNGTLDDGTCAAPTPVINLSPDEGTVPLLVTLDASASTDDGTIESYEWAFGDGTIGMGAVVQHTYTATGMLTGTLTLIDNDGLISHQDFEVTVFDEDGDLPCLSALRVLQPASCGNSDGSLAFYGAGIQFSSATLIDTVTQISYEANNQNQFLDLPSSVYELTLEGPNSCMDDYILHFPTDSTTCENWYPDPCNLKMGMNLDGPVYWSTQRPFKNLFWEGSDFFTYTMGPGGGSTIWNSEQIHEMEIDSAGYPIELPQITDAGPQAFRKSLGADTGHLKTGDYVLLYDGQGTLFLNGFGFTVTDTQMGRIAFEITETVNNVQLQMMASQLGNHLRNIRMMRLEFENDDLAANPFNPQFLAHLVQFDVIRFMNWGPANNSRQVDWTDRRLPYFNTQTTVFNGSNPLANTPGVAYEHMIQLCNLLQKDAWICVPHQATDDYQIEMANLFLEQLDPNLTIYLEYSNEVWNGNFEQTHWVGENAPSNLNFRRAGAERAKNTFNIWHEVYGDEKDRVKRVLATQARNNGVSEQLMAQIGADSFDYLSPTWYFRENRNTVEDDATALDIIENARNNFHAQWEDYIMDYWNARLFGKSVINYEGGQHISGGGNNNLPYLQALYDAQIHPEMYDLYREVMDSLQVWGSELAVAYSFARQRQTSNGSWGHLEDIEQDTTAMPAPKFRALIDHIKLCEDDCIPSITLYPPTHNVTNMNRTWQVTDSITTQQHIELTDSARHHRVRYQAGGFVNLLPGFQTELDSSASVEVVIEDCEGLAPIVVSNKRNVWEKLEESPIGGE
ncbi:MAG: PKD domain-containing protein, partial [Chitinophagales bacterium]